MLKLAVLIPTYNNPATLKDVVNGVKEYCGDIIVVDDGSDTPGREVAALLEDVVLLQHSKNRGKGPAIETGIRYAVERGYSHIITFDSDGQHLPKDIDILREAAIREPNTLWIGARLLDSENVPGQNRFANRFSNFWYRVETGIKLDDTQSGLRVYPIAEVSDMKIYSGRYEWELEIMVRAAWRGIEVKNIPVSVYYPPKDERVSHFKPIKDFARISVLNTVLVFVSLFRWWPLVAYRYFSKSEETNLKIAGSIGLGLFFGISPLWGYQMIAAVTVAHLLGLNKIIALVSSNISIPPMIPFILFGSFGVGALILGEPFSLIPSQLTLESISGSLKQYLVGSVVLATLTGVVGMLLSYILLTFFRKRRR